LISSPVFSQTTDWKLSGNVVTTDSRLGTNTNHSLIIETNNYERMRITNSGYLGIGINSPAFKLDVLGSMRFDGTINLPEFATDSASEDVRFLRVDNSGNLIVNGADQFTQVVYEKDCKLLPGGSYPSPLWKSIEGAEFGILCTSIECPARVGIGTELPITELDVRGKIHSSQGIHIGRLNDVELEDAIQVNTAGLEGGNVFRVSDQGHTEINFNGANGDPFRVINYSTDETIARFRADGGADFTFTGEPSEGMLSFNTADDENPLHVFVVTGDGKVWCQGVWVKEAPFWPDYVFHPSYERMSLIELEVYLSKNHHLPNLPTAQEVGENGIDLYETLRLLTEKLEELTLYTIEQQKEINELKAHASK